MQNFDGKCRMSIIQEGYYPIKENIIAVALISVSVQTQKRCSPTHTINMYKPSVHAAFSWLQCYRNMSDKILCGCSISHCFALEHKLLKWEWRCCRDVLPADSCEQTSHCGGTARVKLKFFYHLLSRRVFRETEDYGSGPPSCRWASAPAAVLEGVCSGLRDAQTTSRAFRQEHCAGLSSRGCLTGSSHFKVLLGLIGCQMTRPVLQTARIQHNSHNSQTLFPLISCWFTTLRIPLSQPLVLHYSSQNCFLLSTEKVTRQRKT